MTLFFFIRNIYMLKFDPNLSHRNQELQFKTQLKTLSHPSLFKHLRVNEEGSLIDTNFLVLIWYKLKELLFRSPNLSNKYLKEFKILQLLTSGKKWVNTKDELAMVLALAKRAGLTLKNNQNHSELQALIDDLRSSVLRQPLKKPSVNLAGKFFTHYKKELSVYPASILKIAEAYDMTLPEASNYSEGNEKGYAERRRL